MYRKRLAIAYLVIKGHNYCYRLIWKKKMKSTAEKKTYDSHGEPMSMKPLVTIASDEFTIAKVHGTLTNNAKGNDIETI